MNNYMKKPTEEQISIVLDSYCNKKKGLVSTAKDAGVKGPGIVRKILQDNKIEIRNFSQAAVESNKNRRVYSINEEYFSTQSHNMAYILGFLAADGSISKDRNEIKITVSSVDRELLEKIKRELQYSGDIKDYITSTGFSCSTLKFTSERIKKELANYGVVPAKTFTFKFPENLDKVYWADFIRGYFDGDGSVSTSGPKAIKWQVCSATVDVLEHIVDFLHDNYNIPKVSIRQEERPKHPIYIICYSINSTKKIHDILYTENSLCLKRKKDKFDKLVKNITNN